MLQVGEIQRQRHGHNTGNASIEAFPLKVEELAWDVRVFSEPTSVIWQACCLLSPEHNLGTVAQLYGDIRRLGQYGRVPKSRAYNDGAFCP